jgi:DNA repair exonuclease SbcCD nuclease subunit
MTDYGLPEEAAVLARDIKTYVTIPCVAVVGNHDFESGKIQEVQNILAETGMHILNGQSILTDNRSKSWGRPLPAFADSAEVSAGRCSKSA